MTQPAPLTPQLADNLMVVFNVDRLRAYLSVLTEDLAKGRSVDVERYMRILHDFEEALRAYAAHFTGVA